MSHPVIPALLLAVAAPAMLGVAAEPQVEMGSFSFQQRIIIRIPRMPEPPSPPDAAAQEWREKSAPKCMTLDHVRGAAISDTDSIDLMLDNGDRIRAVLADDCPALGFYSGFYLKQNSDGKVCAERDVIRSRSGAACPIVKFRRLVARH
jgi:hypothetical protein